MPESVPSPWIGKSLTPYIYRVFPVSDLPLTSEFSEDTPANYIFAKQNGGQWTALYIGQTDNITERMASGYEGHERALKKGATHIHVNPHKADNETVRKSEEDDLIAQHAPTCNRQ